MSTAGELILDARSRMSENETNNNERWEQMSSTTTAGVVRRTGEKVGRFYVYEYTTVTGRTFRWHRCEAGAGGGVRAGVEWYLWQVVDGTELDGEYIDTAPLDRHYRPEPWFTNYMNSGMHA
jgi:hypothetical protein